MNRVPTEGVLCDPHEMIHLVKAGDIEALDRMTRCYGQRLLAVGRRYCKSEEDAHDAVQDALLSAGHHLTDFRGDGSLEGWLVRMVTNACYRMRRGRKNDPRLHDHEVELSSTERDSPEDLAGRAQVAEVLGQALVSLSPQDRLILLLAEAEDWTGPQIAERTGMTPGAVRTRLSRARARMRKEVSDWMDQQNLPF